MNFRDKTLTIAITQIKSPLHSNFTCIAGVIFQGGSLSNRIVISKTSIYVLIFLALIQLGIAYYLEPVSDDVISQQEVASKIKLETPDGSKLAVLFEAQQALIESKNDIISTSLSFQKTVGWLFLIFLVMHLVLLTRRSNAVNNNEI